MPTTDKELNVASEALLQALDGAPFAGILKNQEVKDWLETLVLQAFRKLDAAQHHHTNIQESIYRNKKRFEEHIKADNYDAGGLLNAASTHVGVVPASDLAYELDALLAAIRSSIDFGGRILALHLGMDKKTSISEVLKLVKKSPNPPFAFLLEWAPWIEDVREYRDQCTHYRTLRLHTGYEAIHRNGVLTWALRPAVIPKAHGHDRPDTRRDRMMEDQIEDPVGLNRSASSMSVKAPDGTVLQFEHSVEYMPADGYILVEQFSSQHVRHLQGFLTAVFEGASAAKFSFQSGT